MKKPLLLFVLVFTVPVVLFALDPPSGYDECEPVMGASHPTLVCQRGGDGGGIDTCTLWNGGWVCGGSSTTGGPRTY